ncbi:MAG: signal peptidase I [Candidatus Andersenbacteria bacterium RIFCSPHIGHO2_12_FULL_46_9]|nr:MAG: signal peptidase I [Candidatus Andersenbacteria bacterium RIFCSPHIGHO2_02_FULL_46_16]OGY36395.1 MAG: signal peptidase I [Candidatus Andersenbacteria bacterium RIFCSPHIGHO2_12_FULL_46_9]OGY37904.1 MAG: signal peptidase I [Candidatus Andersenbacteria bacterium RIFCSPLOWO2_02_FULL_46_11]OGY42685.1 MAG: signal peptidase I [Candidatus Andersenbacteria bacterium RIFCSPLOWO2_12_FULL_45_8]
MVIIVPIRYFLVQPFFVRGASMEPNFYDGEYLVVDELSYFLRDAQRGEVIVFRFPQNRSQFFIKRIIGLPGESVRINNGQVEIINDDFPAGVVLDEAQYLPGDMRTGGQIVVELGEKEYFVLGDNRPASSDSRSWGILGEDEIVGRAWLRAFPIDRLGVINFNRPGFVSL